MESATVGMSVARKRSMSRMPLEEAEVSKLLGTQKEQSHEPLQQRNRPYTYTIGAGALACILLLFWALSRTAPSYFSAQQAPNTPLQCKALDDAGKARILGSQNQVVYHAIATHSQDAQTLFSLGLLHAYGFNQMEATLMFEAALRLDPTCARCAWGLAHASGPMPNVVAGNSSDPYPVFDAAAAQRASDALQSAIKLADAQAGNGGGAAAGTKHRRLGIVGSSSSSSHGNGSSSSSSDGGGGSSSSASNALDLGALLARDRRYIDAMGVRYKGGVAALQEGRWLENEAAYAAAMEALAEASDPQDADAYALAAEAHMNLSPWAYYTATGLLKANAAKAEALIHTALALNPSHILALHLHIHLAEASVPGPPGQVAAAATSTAAAAAAAAAAAGRPAGTEAPATGQHGGSSAAAPGAGDAAGSAGAADGAPLLTAARAEGSADALAVAEPQDGHLLHMPSHLFVRVGRYKDAVSANERAYALDVARAKHCVIPYVPEHNVDMLNYAASMAGMYHAAERFAQTIRILRTQMPDIWISSGSEWATLPLVWVRFGRWHEVLSMEPPPADARGPASAGGPEYSRAVYHYARTLAFAARARAAQGVEDAKAEAVAELAKLKAAVQQIPEDVKSAPGSGVGLYSATYRALGAIHLHTAEAALHLLSNRNEAAVEALQAAVVHEDGLGYMEPPRLAHPVRQCLGYVLLSSGRADEAVQMYEEELTLYHPENAWSLLGLKQARPGDAELAKRWKAAAASADVSIDSSCPALATSI